VSNHIILIQSAAEELLKRLHVDGIVKINKRDEAIVVDIESVEAAVLIGNKGESLDALQHLLRLSLNRHFDEYVSVVVDVENYRKRREEYVRTIAEKIARRVAREGRPESMNPMSAGERRIVHMIVQKVEGVVSESVGEGENRQVVIKPLMKAIW